VVLVVPSRPYSAWGWCTGVNYIYRSGMFMAAEQAGWHTHDRAVEERKQPHSSPLHLDLLRCVVVHTGTVQVRIVSSMQIISQFDVSDHCISDTCSELLLICNQINSSFSFHSDQINSILFFSFLIRMPQKFTPINS
jgi:hypothetical protein